MKFRINCEVSGGATGYRNAYLKRNGKQMVFDTQAEADAAAADLNKTMNGKYAVATFRYTVEDYLTTTADVLTNFSIPGSLETVWNALHTYRQDYIPEGDADNDEQWDDICTAMAWITEALEADKPMSGAELLATHSYKGQEALDLD